MEFVVLPLAIISGILALVGGIWIAVIAFQNGEIVMGVLSILCGIVALIYAVQNLDECKIPLGLLIVGVVGNIVSRVLGAGLV